MDAPERWLAQDAILREARFACGMGLHDKAEKLAMIAAGIGPFSPEHDKEFNRILDAHGRHHFKKAAA